MPWLPKKCVVVPIDFSDAAPKAISLALELVASPADVHVIHVLVDTTGFSVFGEWAPLKEGESWDGAARKYLAEWLAEQHFTGVTQEVRLGDPGFAITEFARERNADLIVIPSHGYHGVTRILLGSVAGRVIHYATCPVLVLRRDGD